MNQFLSRDPIFLYLILFSACLTLSESQTVSTFVERSQGWKWTTDDSHNFNLNTSPKFDDVIGLGESQFHTQYDDPEVTKQETENIARKIMNSQLDREEAFKNLSYKYPYNPEAQFITNLPTRDLQRRLQTRSLTARQVLSAYIAKALNVTYSLNCVSNFIPQAEKWADSLDSLSAAKGPYHGVPFAVSDEIDIEGMDSTLGLGKRVGVPANKTSAYVKSLMDLGMIPFAKTNVGQTLLSIDTENPVFGRTSNINNKELSPGGADGGAAALVGVGGSLLALGADLFGSVRIPAHFSGITAFKAGAERSSMKGVQTPVPFAIGVNAIPSLMAKDPSFLVQVHGSLYGRNLLSKHDATVPPVGWNDRLFVERRPLRIGCYSNLSFFPTFGDIDSAVKTFKATLTSRGYRAVPIELPPKSTFMKIFYDLLWADGGQQLKQIFKYEKFSDSLSFLHEMASLPSSQKEIKAYTVRFPLHENHTDRTQEYLRGGVDVKRPKDLQNVEHQRKQLRNQIIKMMDDMDLDLIIGPTFPLASLTTREASQLFPAVAYTAIWNLIDLPAGVIKFGTESGDKLGEYDTQNDYFLTLAKSSAMKAKGLPLSIQIVARPFNEELVLKVMLETKEASGDYVIIGK